MEDLIPRSRVGPYELVAPIGSGGMGEVWKARDTRLDRTVAIKFSQAQFTHRFEREARAIAALNHPNIGQIYDLGENYIVMEYIDGDPVRAPDSIRKVLDIAVQIADGLAAAHLAGFVHRDLKPDNILLTRDGRVKLLDFGLAKQVVSGPEEATIAISDPGTVAGTVAYMSPEQAGGHDMDLRSDQFSLGIILYELATGKRAFQRPSAAETMTAIIREEPEPLPASIPAPLRWSIERCLAKNPAARYDSTRDLYRELLNIRDRLSEVEQTATAAQERRSVRPIPALVSALIAGLVVFLVMRAREPWRPELSRFRFLPFATEPYAEYSAAWSPDGRSIVYCAISANECRIMVKSPDGSGAAVLAAHPYRPGGFIGLESPSWSGDSSRVFYIYEGQPWSVSRTGGAPGRLPLPPGVMVNRLAAAPDGSALALLENQRGEKGARHLLSISSPAGATAKILFEPKGTLDSVSWSRDSSRLLASEDTGTGQRLWLVKRSGEARQVFDGEGLESVRTAWLPGNRYAVLATSPSDQGIGVIDTETGKTTSVLPSATPVGSVSVAPDGKRLAYTLGLFHTILVQIPLDGAASRTFLSSSLNHSELSWAPSGDEFVYVLGEEIRIRNRSGTSERTVVSRSDFPGYQGTLNFEKPSFSPDGQRILYTLFGYQGRPQGTWISPVGGGPPAAVEKAIGHAPIWSADGGSILVGTPAGLLKYRLGSNDAPVSIYPGGCDPSPSPDGNWILCPHRVAGTIILSPDGKNTRMLSQTASATGTWAKDSQSVYLLTLSDKQELLQIDIHSLHSRVVSVLPERLDVRGPFGGPTRMALSPDGKSAITTVRQNDGEIWILDGFEPPRTVWGSLWPLKR